MRPLAVQFSHAAAMPPKAAALDAAHSCKITWRSLFPAREFPTTPSAKPID